MIRSRMTSLDENGRARARRALMRRDPILADVIRRAGPCWMEHRGAPYRILLRSVIYQQLAGAAARTIDGRLRAPWRGRYPRPEVLLAAPDAQLRAAGLSRQKIAAVRAVAQAFAAGDVTNRRLRAMDDDAVVEAVTRIHGSGEWTAHMLMMFSVGCPGADMACGRGRCSSTAGASCPSGASSRRSRRDGGRIAGWRRGTSGVSWTRSRRGDDRSRSAILRGGRPHRLEA